jgi:hypothetical protein
METKALRRMLGSGWLLLNEGLSQNNILMNSRRMCQTRGIHRKHDKYQILITNPQVRKVNYGIKVLIE